MIYQGLGPIAASRIRYFEKDTGFPEKIRKNLTAPLENNYNHYMGLHDNLQHLINYPGESGELLSRYVTNAMGHKEIVVMRKVHWDYMDWLIERGAMRLEAVVPSIQEEQPSIELGEALMTWLSEVCDDREAMGLPQPSWLPAPDS